MSKFVSLLVFVCVCWELSAGIRLLETGTGKRKCHSMDMFKPKKVCVFINRFNDES